MISFHTCDKALSVEGVTNDNNGKICFTFFTGKKTFFTGKKSNFEKQNSEFQIP